MRASSTQEPHRLLSEGVRAEPHSACAEKVAACQVKLEVTGNGVEDSWEEHNIRRQEMPF